MSMYRQLWLSILVSVSLALGASLFAALINARVYLEEQLAMKNRDNAATLALAISQGNPDVGDVVLAVTAQFNSGQYEAIRVVDPLGKVLVEKISPEKDEEVPEWFMRWLPIAPVAGQAHISSGWSQVGTLTLLSHSHFAYQALWDSARSLVAAILLAGILAWILVILALKRLQGPMQAVIEQARAISERRFMTIPEPRVPELKQLAAAMNASVERIRVMVEEDARDCDALRLKANYDPLTGLANRAFFITNLKASLASDYAMSGSLALLRMAPLEQINLRYGHHETDALLQNIAKILARIGERHSGNLVGRLGGADFGLTLASKEDPQTLLPELRDKIQQLLWPYAGRVHIGYTDLIPGEDEHALMARVDTALASAVSSGISCIHEVVSLGECRLPGNSVQWRERLRDALADVSSLRLFQRKVRHYHGQEHHIDCPLHIRISEPCGWLPPRYFLPQAERCGLIGELDLVSVALALKVLSEPSPINGLWMTLSAHSMVDPEFRARLVKTLQGCPEAGRLWLEIAETGAMHHLEAYRVLIKDLEPVGCQVGLGHYGFHFDQVGLLSELGLDFLKVDASFVRGIEDNAGNQAFLQGLRDITHTLGIKLYAGGVETEAESSKLAEIGFEGATGPLMGMA